MLATNHLGPFLLTNLLRDQLSGGGRVITVSAPSGTHVDVDRLLNRAEVGEGEALGTPRLDDRDRLEPGLDVDVGWGSGRHDQLDVGDADRGDVADEGGAAFLVEIADVMGGVAGRVGDSHAEHVLVACERLHVGLGNRHDLAPETLHLIAVEPPDLDQRQLGELARQVHRDLARERHVLRAPLAAQRLAAHAETLAHREQDAQLSWSHFEIGDLEITQRITGQIDLYGKKEIGDQQPNGHQR